MNLKFRRNGGNKKTLKVNKSSKFPNAAAPPCHFLKSVMYLAGVLQVSLDLFLEEGFLCQNSHPAQNKNKEKISCSLTRIILTLNFLTYNY